MFFKDLFTCAFMHMSACLHAQQKKQADPIMDGCEPTMWLLGIELSISERAVKCS